jgi:small subunit ribosomal protein S16
MAVSIRLRREGTKNRSFYRVVVADKRSPRDGKFIEAIGNYDPQETEGNFRLDLDRVDYWLGHGARPSATVASMILKARKKVAAPLSTAQ